MESSNTMQWVWMVSVVGLMACKGASEVPTESDTDTDTDSDTDADTDSDTDTDTDSDTDTDTDSDTDADTDSDTDTDTDTDVPGPTGCAVDRWDPADFTTVYDVGPGQALADPNAVPWETVGPDTLVRIWPASAPYRTKFVLNATGTASEPVVVIGVCDPATGDLPIFDADGATTRQQLSYWSETRGVIKIGGASVPAGPASHIYVEDLDIRGARDTATFTDDGGGVDTYDDNASAIFIESGRHITLRGNRFTDSGNGLFVAWAAEDVRVIGNHLSGNGNVGSFLEHNSYTEALGILFEYNDYGPLCTGCDGNNLKDRSAGTVVRYNRIVGGNRQLDLVDSGHSEIFDDPSYSTTFVYGNELIELEDAGNRQIVHYGGDGTAANFRQGTLYFFHNTVVSERAGRSTLLRLSDANHTAVLENNIVHALGDLEIQAEGRGTVLVEDSWVVDGWVDSFVAGTGTVSANNVVTGSDPGLTDLTGLDLRPTSGSPVIGIGGPLQTTVHTVDREYIHPSSGTDRADDGSPDAGAFEFP